jgi:hypothetical protein
VKVVAEMAEWNPYLVYGGLALKAFRTASSVIESLFERSCFEVARPEAVKGKTIIHKFLVFRKKLQSLAKTLTLAFFIMQISL